MAQSCTKTNDNRTSVKCPYCESEYKHQYSLNKHIRDKHSALVTEPSPVVETHPVDVDIVPNIQHSNVIQSNNNICHNDIKNVNHNHNHNQNNFNINFAANLDVDHVFNLISTKFGPEYIKKGETGLYDFIYYEIFTDPVDSSKTAIVCNNYKDHVFYYAVLDEHNKPIIREDISLEQLNKFLSNYNFLFRSIINSQSPCKIGCIGVTNNETRKNLDALVDAMTERKKMPIYIAEKIKTDIHREDAWCEPVLTEEMTRLKIKNLEQQGKMSYSNQTLNEQEQKAMDDLALRDRLLAPDRLKVVQQKMKAGKAKVMRKTKKRNPLKPTKPLETIETIQEE